MQTDPTQGEGSSELTPVDQLAHGWLNTELTVRGVSVRKRGLVKLAVGIPLAAGWFFLQQRIEALNEWLRLLIPGFPGVLALIGLIELVSGIPISKLSASWASLTGWQRLVLGLIIVITFFGLIFTGVYLCLVPAA